MSVDFYLFLAGLKQNTYSMIEQLFNCNILTMYPNHFNTSDSFKILTEAKSELIANDFDSIEKDLERALFFLADHNLVFSGNIEEDRIVITNVCVLNIIATCLSRLLCFGAMFQKKKKKKDFLSNDYVLKSTIQDNICRTEIWMLSLVRRIIILSH